MAPSPRGGSWEAWARGGGGPGPAGSAGSAGSVGGGCSSSGGEDAWGGDWEERVGAALGALAGAPSREGFGAAALEDLSAAPDLPCCRHWPAVAATLPGLLRRPSCRAGAAGLLDALWADLVPSGSPQLLDLFEAAAVDLVGGVPPFRPAPAAVLRRGPPRCPRSPGPGRSTRWGGWGLRSPLSCSRGSPTSGQWLSRCPRPATSWISACRAA